MAGSSFFVAQHPNPALHHSGFNIARALRPDVHLGSPSLPLLHPINLTTTRSPDFLATRPHKPNPQPPTMPPTPKPREVVHIYIDNSNLWIQGQRTYAEKKRMSVSLDPTWRFDVGRLRDIVIEGLGGDSPSSTFDVRTSLYGSIPPPVDSIWVAISSKDVKVFKFARSTWTGREKSIDSSIIADSIVQASMDERDCVASTFVIVSGDADISQAVGKITGVFGLAVHVWSWRNGLAAAYKKPQELVTVHLLDDHLERVGFSATDFNVDRATIHGHSIVILDPVPHADVINRIVDGIQIPLYKYENPAQRPGASSKDLIIIPVSSRYMEFNDLEDLFQTVKRKLVPHGLTVVTYKEYSQQQSPADKKQGLAVSNRFKELPVDEEGPGVEDGLGEAEGGFVEQDWQWQKKRRQFQASERKIARRCKWRMYCKKGSECGFGHSKDEEQYFKAYGRGKRASKYRMCIHENCLRGTRCTYAHSRAELLCLTCDKRGHEMGDLSCPENEEGEGQRWRDRR